MINAKTTDTLSCFYRNLSQINLHNFLESLSLTNMKPRTEKLSKWHRTKRKIPLLQSRLFLSFAFLFFLAILACSENDPPPPITTPVDPGIDLVVILDQSGSIHKTMPAIKDYVRNTIFGKISNQNDRLYLFSFDGDFYFHKQFDHNFSPEQVDEALELIEASGQYTDLVNAVERMTQYLDRQLSKDRKKLVFFLTDGKNDPPANSPYKEGLDHKFFQKAEQRVNQGWRVYISSIGSDTDGAAVAGMIGAEHIELPDQANEKQMEDQLTETLTEARDEMATQARDEALAQRPSQESWPWTWYALAGLGTTLLLLFIVLKIRQLFFTKDKKQGKRIRF